MKLNRPKITSEELSARIARATGQPCAGARPELWIAPGSSAQLLGEGYLFESDLRLKGKNFRLPKFPAFIAAFKNGEVESCRTANGLN